MPVLSETGPHSLPLHRLEAVGKFMNVMTHPSRSKSPKNSIIKTASSLLTLAAFAIAVQACNPLSPAPDVEATQKPGITQPADCPPPQICYPESITETQEYENQQTALILRELLGINPATSQAELANIILEKQQNTDWLFRPLSDGLPITTPEDTTSFALFDNWEGQTISYGLDPLGEHWIELSYSPEDIYVPQYPEIDYKQFDTQKSIGTVPMRSFTDGSNSIYLYAPEDTLVELTKLWTSNDLKNFLHDYFGDPNSGIRKRLHLVFAPSSQNIQLGLEEPFNLESEVKYAAVLSLNPASFDVVVNIPGVHANSLVQELPLSINLGATLTNERFGFYAAGYPEQKSDTSILYFEAVSTIAEWLYLFDPDMRGVLMGGYSYSNFLGPLAEFLKQTVPLKKPQIAPSSFASPRYHRF